MPGDIIEFYEDDELDYLKDWYGLFHKEPDKETVNQLNNIPLEQLVNPEWYCNIGVVKPNPSLKEI